MCNVSEFLHSPQSGSRCSHGGERKATEISWRLKLVQLVKTQQGCKKSLVCVCVWHKYVCVCLQSPSLSSPNTKSLPGGGADREEETEARSVWQGCTKRSPRDRQGPPSTTHHLSKDKVYFFYNLLNTFSHFLWQTETFPTLTSREKSVFTLGSGKVGVSMKEKEKKCSGNWNSKIKSWFK